jgi:hypothetical protein
VPGLEEVVRERGGVTVASAGEAARVAGSRFAAVLVDDDALLPAIAKLADLPETYLLKEGLVGGPEGATGALEVEPGFVGSVLDAALAGEVVWERDPDFGYEVAAAASGVAFPDDGLLLPRLLYSRSGRVYEHAALVAETRVRWAETLGLGSERG